MRDETLKPPHSRRQPAFFAALAPYLGGKRRPAPLLLAVLQGFLPRERWRDPLFLDPFSGGCAVALYAKANGFQVIASDVAERAALAARALVANSSVRLRRYDVLSLFAEPEHPYPATASEFEPLVFTPDQARFLDRAFANAAARPEPIRSLLRLTLVSYVLRLFPMSLPSASDAAHAAAGSYDRISTRRLGHYLRTRDAPQPARLWSAAERVNAGVVGGSGEAERGDALDVLGRTVADVVYLDPPYPGTTRYGPSYRLVDALVGDEQSAAPTPSLEEVLEAAVHVPLLVLSYGGPGLALSDVTATVRRFRPIHRALSIPYPRLRAIAKEETNARSSEFLIVAGQ